MAVRSIAIVAPIWLLVLAHTTAASDTVELTQSDLDQITNLLVINQPELSGSLGIKHVYATRSSDGIDATVIFWPFERSFGVATSRIASCTFRNPSTGWRCEQARSREYLSIPTQEKEVVVLGSMDPTTALAAIAFARESIASAAQPDQAVPNKVILIHPNVGGNIVISFGSSDTTELSVELRLSESDAQAPEFELVAIDAT